MTFAFAAAGTGGHVFPAIAVADALVAAGVAREDVAFYGGERMEATTIPAAGYAFVPVEIRGLRRSLSTDNLRLPGMVRRAAGAIEADLRDRKARAMTVFGGYVSVPAAWAARRVGASVYLHEQNAVPGLANRLVAMRAKASFVAFPEAAAKLHRARVVGNPLRQAIAVFDRGERRPQALQRYGLPEGPPVLGVIGGSQGARVLNDIVTRLARDCDPGAMSIVHLTGRSHAAEIEPMAERSRSYGGSLPSKTPWRTSMPPRIWCCAARER